MTTKKVKMVLFWYFWFKTDYKQIRENLKNEQQTICNNCKAISIKTVINLYDVKQMSPMGCDQNL